VDRVVKHEGRKAGLKEKIKRNMEPGGESPGFFVLDL